MFKIRFFVAVFSCVLVHTSIAQKTITESVWSATPRVIDGNADDWKQPFRYYDSKSKMEFSFSNDVGNLYIVIKTSDNQTQRAIIRNGIQLWLDGTGKKAANTGIMFPLKAQIGKAKKDEAHTDEMTTAHKLEMAERNRRLMEQLSAMKVSGFATIPSSIIPLQNEYGLTAAIAIDSLQQMTVEYKISLHTFIAKRDSTKPIALCVSLADIQTGMSRQVAGAGDGNEMNGGVDGTMANMNERGSGIMGQQNNGGGLNSARTGDMGQQSSDMRSPTNGAPSMNSAPVYETVNVWFKVKLANQ